MWSCHTGREQHLSKLHGSKVWLSYGTLEAREDFAVDSARVPAGNTEFYEGEKLRDEGRLGSLGLRVVSEVIRDKIHDICDMINPNCLKRNVAVRLWDLGPGHLLPEACRVMFTSSNTKVEARAGAVFPGTLLSVGLSPNSATGDTVVPTQFLPTESWGLGRGRLTWSTGRSCFPFVISPAGRVVAWGSSQKRMCSFLLLLLLFLFLSPRNTLPFGLTSNWPPFKVISGVNSSVKASLTPELSWRLFSLNSYFYFGTDF